MTDAISRSRVLDGLIKAKSKVYKDQSVCAKIIDEMLDIFADAINKEPALDVAPVVHARWNKEDGTCSSCYHEACYDEWTEPKWDYDWDENLVQTGEETHIQFIFSPFCPNCGARMDGEAHD